MIIETIIYNKIIYNRIDLISTYNLLIRLLKGIHLY